MESIHENDDIDITYPIWIPVDIVAGWRGILAVLSPEEIQNAAPLFSSEMAAKQFIAERDEWTTVGTYEPAAIKDLDELLRYFDHCETEEMNYVALDIKTGEWEFGARFRRISSLRKHLLKRNDSLSACDDAQDT
jgi:hypothetical protein